MLRRLQSLSFGLLLTAAAARAEDWPRLQVRPPLAPGVEAFPRIQFPSAAGARVNAALAELDARVLPAIQDCRDDAHGAAAWKRYIWVPMRGPRFLSFDVADTFNCGGARVDTAEFVVTYDLRTGQPADWLQLLPPSLAGQQAPEVTADGGMVIPFKSSALSRLFLAGYPAKLPIASQNLDCREVLSEPGIAFFLAPSARRGGLSLIPTGLPHAAQACSASVTIPAAELRRLGAPAELIGAIGAAHQASSLRE